MSAEDNNEDYVTVDVLDGIITAPSGGLKMEPSSAYDEVYDNVLVGEESFARDLVQLRGLGVTHVLNAAQGEHKFQVDTDHHMYRRIKVTFMGVKAMDFMNFDLYPFFHDSADFIDTALNGGGKILVHCIQGMSRSATLVLAFLMIRRHMKVKDALRLVRSRREVCPNVGFLQQLIKLHTELTQAGHYDQKTQNLDKLPCG